VIGFVGASGSPGPGLEFGQTELSHTAVQGSWLAVKFWIVLSPARLQVRAGPPMRLVVADGNTRSLDFARDDSVGSDLWRACSSPSFVRRVAIQARFRLEWGCSRITDFRPTYKIDCLHAMGTDTFSAERAKSFRHILVSFGAGAASLQTLCLWLCSHA
jgi:hypothetical protein